MFVSDMSPMPHVTVDQFVKEHHSKKKKNHNKGFKEILEKEIQREMIHAGEDTRFAHNRMELSGVAITTPEYSHTTRGEKFYKFEVKSLRHSDTPDFIPCICSEFLVEDIKGGDRVHLLGQARTQNLHDADGKSHLNVYFFACERLELIDEDINEVEFDGYLTRGATRRNTPFGREIADILIAVNMAYGRSSYLPCIAWGRNATKCTKMGTGDHVTCVGRFQSRDYQKFINDETVTKTTYEMSLSAINEIGKEEKKNED